MSVTHRGEMNRMFGSVILMLWLSYSSSLWIGSLESANLFPKDTFLFVGDNITLWVDVAGSNLNLSATRLRITLENKSSMDMYLTAVNDTHGYFKLHATEELLGRNSATCSPLQSHFDCSTYVTIERRLKPVNFSQAIWYYNDSKKMSIKWQPVDYFHPEYFEAKALWSPNKEPIDSSSTCNITGNGCLIEDFSSQSLIKVKVIYKLKDQYQNKFNEYREFIELAEPPVFTKDSIYEIIPQNEILPDFEVLTLDSRTSRCLNISWKSPVSCNDFRHLLLYETLLENQENPIKLKGQGIFQCDKEKKSVVLTFCDLDPATKYYVSVKVKLYPLGHWSDTKSLEALTAEDRPDKSPTLSGTNVYFGQCDANRLRPATVIWNPPDKAITHGELTGYSIKFDNMTTSLPPSVTSATETIFCDKEVHFEITSQTQVGFAWNSSLLTIPSEKEALSVDKNLDFQVEKMKVNESLGLADMKVLWKIGVFGEDQDAFVFIYHCILSPLAPVEFRHCDDDFQMVKERLELGHVELKNISSKTDMFGFAISTKSQKSAIQEIDCIYDPERLPKKAPIVTAITGQKRAIIVTFNAQRCSKVDLTWISKFHIEFCQLPLEDHEKLTCFFRQVEGNVSSYQEKDLNPAYYYTIRVWSESLKGPGPKSESVKVQPIEGISNDNDETQILVRLVLPLMVIVFVVILCCCFVQYVLKRKKKLRMDSPKDDFLDDFESTGSESGESGVYSTKSEEGTLTGSEDEQKSSSQPHQTNSYPTSDMTNSYPTSDMTLSSENSCNSYVHIGQGSSLRAHSSGSSRKPGEQVISQNIIDEGLQGKLDILDACGLTANCESTNKAGNIPEPSSSDFQFSDLTKPANVSNLISPSSSKNTVLPTIMDKRLTEVVDKIKVDSSRHQGHPEVFNDVRNSDVVQFSLENCGNGYSKFKPASSEPLSELSGTDFSTKIVSLGHQAHPEVSNDVRNSNVVQFSLENCGNGYSKFKPASSEPLGADSSTKIASLGHQAHPEVSNVVSSSEVQFSLENCGNGYSKFKPAGSEPPGTDSSTKIVSLGHQTHPEVSNDVRNSDVVQFSLEKCGNGYSKFKPASSEPLGADSSTKIVSLGHQGHPEVSNDVRSSDVVQFSLENCDNGNSKFKPASSDPLSEPPGTDSSTKIVSLGHQAHLEVSKDICNSTVPCSLENCGNGYSKFKPASSDTPIELLVTSSTKLFPHKTKNDENNSIDVSRHADDQPDGINRAISQDSGVEMPVSPFCQPAPTYQDNYVRL